MRTPGRSGFEKGWGTDMRTLISTLLFTCIVSASAAAQSPLSSANEIMEACQNIARRADITGGDLEAVKRGFCYGTVTALTFNADRLTAGSRFCPPMGVTNRQSVQVVVAFLERNPQRTHEQFSHLALEALREAWPCN